MCYSVIVFGSEGKGLEDADKGSAAKALTKAKQKHLREYEMMYTITDVLSKRGKAALDEYCRLGKIRNFGPVEGIGAIYEIRTPKIAPGGVLRTYFCYDYINPDEIVLLDCEFKTDAKADLAPAKRRMKVLWEGED
jgi:hypothetical protein